MGFQDLRRRAKKGKWAQKILAILFTIMMITVGATYLITSLF